MEFDGGDAGPSEQLLLLEELAELLKRDRPPKRFSTKRREEQKERKQSPTKLKEYNQREEKATSAKEEHQVQLPSRDALIQKKNQVPPSLARAKPKQKLEPIALQIPDSVADPFESIQADDVEALRAWIHFKGPSRSTMNLIHPETGRTLLQEACAKGNEAIVRHLVSFRSVNINKRTMLGKQTALHLAASQGHNNIVRVLLNAGANSSLRNALGEQPLHLATDLFVVKSLLSLGRADPFAKTRAGLTASQTAALRDQMDVYQAIQQAVLNIERIKKEEVRRIADKRRQQEAKRDAEHRQKEMERWRQDMENLYSTWRK